MGRLRTNITSDSKLLAYAKRRLSSLKGKKKHEVVFGALISYERRRTGRKQATILDLPHYLFAAGFAAYSFKRLPRFLKAATTRDQLADPAPDSPPLTDDSFFEDVQAPNSNPVVNMPVSDDSFDPNDEDIKVVGGWNVGGTHGVGAIISDTVFSDLPILSEYYNGYYIDREPFVRFLDNDRFFISMTFSGAYGSVLRIRVSNDYLKQISGGYSVVTGSKSGGGGWSAYHGGVNPAAAPATYIHNDNTSYAAVSCVTTGGGSKDHDFGTPALLLTNGTIGSLTTGVNTEVSLRLLGFPGTAQFPQENGGYPSLSIETDDIGDPIPPPGELKSPELTGDWAVYTTLGVATDGSEDVIYGSYFAPGVGFNDNGYYDYYTVETLFRVVVPRPVEGSPTAPASWTTIKCYESDYGPGTHAFNTVGEPLSGFVTQPVVALRSIPQDEQGPDGRTSVDWAIVPRIYSTPFENGLSPRPWTGAEQTFLVQHEGYDDAVGERAFVTFDAFFDVDLVVLRDGAVYDEGVPVGGKMKVAYPPAGFLSYPLRYPGGDKAEFRFADEYIAAGLDTVGFVFCAADDTNNLRLGYWNSFSGFGFFDVDLSHLWPELPTVPTAEPAGQMRYIPWYVGVSVYRRCYEKLDSGGNVVGVDGEVGALLYFPAIGEQRGGDSPAGIAIVNGDNAQWIREDSTLFARIVGNATNPADDPNSTMYRRT